MAVVSHTQHLCFVFCVVFSRIGPIRLRSYWSFTSSFWLILRVLFLSYPKALTVDAPRRFSAADLLKHKVIALTLTVTLTLTLNLTLNLAHSKPFLWDFRGLFVYLVVMSWPCLLQLSSPVLSSFAGLDFPRREAATSEMRTPPLKWDKWWHQNHFWN